MNAWLTDSNNHNAGLGGPTDSPMAYLQPPQTINPAQFQSQPYLNGNARTASPSFQNPIYQTNSVVPSKRQREDNLGQSPRQPPGGLPGSRSQTPSGAYPGYNPQTNGGTILPMHLHLITIYRNASTSQCDLRHLRYKQMAFNNAANSQRPSHRPHLAHFSPHHGGMPQMSTSTIRTTNSRVGISHDTSQKYHAEHEMEAKTFNPGQFGRPMGNPQMGMGGQHIQPGGVNDAQRQYQMQMQAQVQAQARHYQQQQAAQARIANGGPIAGKHDG